jgi:hypothetical protein
VSGLTATCTACGQRDMRAEVWRAQQEVAQQVAELRASEQRLLRQLEAECAHRRALVCPALRFSRCCHASADISRGGPHVTLIAWSNGYCASTSGRPRRRRGRPNEAAAAAARLDRALQHRAPAPLLLPRAAARGALGAPER